MAVFTIDNVEYNVMCSIEREAEIKASDISGMLMDGTIFWDILGTYMTYDVKLTMPLRNKARYAMLIDQLTEPVDGHTFVLPYDDGEIELTGKVDAPADVWEELPSGYTFWKGLKFTITANHPSREMSLEDVINRGLPTIPDVSEPEIGDTYTYTADGWEKVTS